MFLDFGAILTAIVIVAGSMILRLSGYDLNKFVDWLIETVDVGSARLKNIMKKEDKNVPDDNDSDKKD